MEKYFVTYQPQRVSEILSREDYTLTNTDYNSIKNEFGYSPIFFIPLENKMDFFIKNFFSTPSKPDVMIIVKLDRFDCIDAVKWYEMKGNIKIYESLRASTYDKREKEYISERIERNNIENIILVDEMTKNILGINNENQTKMLMFSKAFWDSLEKYFWKSDERDMYKFICSDQFGYVLDEYKRIMNEHKTELTFIMQWFRDKLSEVSNNFDWF